MTAVVINFMEYKLRKQCSKYFKELGTTMVLTKEDASDILNSKEMMAINGTTGEFHGTRSREIEEK